MTSGLSKKSDGTVQRCEDQDIHITSSSMTHYSAMNLSSHGTFRSTKNICENIPYFGT